MNDVSVDVFNEICSHLDVGSVHSLGESYGPMSMWNQRCRDIIDRKMMAERNKFHRWMEEETNRKRDKKTCIWCKCPIRYVKDNAVVEISIAGVATPNAVFINHVIFTEVIRGKFFNSVEFLSFNDTFKDTFYKDHAERTTLINQNDIADRFEKMLMNGFCGR